jgi:hypothetical protein
MAATTATMMSAATIRTNTSRAMAKIAKESLSFYFVAGNVTAPLTFIGPRTIYSCSLLSVCEMADDETIRLRAVEHISQQGPYAVTWLLEQAELADGLADYEAAKALRAIAAAAERILKDRSTPA